MTNAKNEIRVGAVGDDPGVVSTERAGLVVERGAKARAAKVNVAKAGVDGLRALTGTVGDAHQQN